MPLVNQTIHDNRSLSRSLFNPRRPSHSLNLIPRDLQILINTITIYLFNPKGPSQNKRVSKRNYIMIYKPIKTIQLAILITIAVYSF